MTECYENVKGITLKKLKIMLHILWKMFKNIIKSYQELQKADIAIGGDKP